MEITRSLLPAEPVHKTRELHIGELHTDADDDDHNSNLTQIYRTRAYERMMHHLQASQTPETHSQQQMSSPRCYRSTAAVRNFIRHRSCTAAGA